ncbi:glutaminyl-peptide cyclotransferase-like [Microplitis mediator]|uniref:glutaminyl-peptide cyclotransferase-like n=1 Tax=Microplitis mediator TaxID=375433 RepID=UPI0025537352|nr:glutaminyl-peptide cyclotransferase-like [Microplitis mediator]
MYRLWLNFFLLSLVSCVTSQNNFPLSFRNAKHEHVAKNLSNTQIQSLASLSNVSHVEEILNEICIVRVVGSLNHAKVKNYIKKTMKNLGWSIERDEFYDVTPTFGKLKFENIIATLNPNAKRYLSLACHYDSKYTREGNFVGATDSAVPCAQLINLATVMKSQLEPLKNADLSLMFIFFDGEEAFDTWGPKDSIYGARHLADKWHSVKQTYGEENDISNLDKMDVLVLLDLLGAPNPNFYNFFDNTARWYSQLILAENRLHELSLLKNYDGHIPSRKYFQPQSVSSYIEDDHIPFLKKNVPILHLIPHPFPDVWHKPSDNLKNIDLTTTENLNKIIRVFVATYFGLSV